MTTEKPFEHTPLGSVLVTGGCGFLGSHIVSVLNRRYTSPSTTISVFDLHTSRNIHPGVSYHSGDVTSEADVRMVLETTKPDVIIHTASPVATSVHGAAARKKQEAIFRKVNVDGTRVLVEEAMRAGVKAFVYTSSASVISDTTTDLLNASEEYDLIRQPLQPEYYSDTKAEAEDLVLDANNRPTPSNPTSFLTTAIRPSAMFGEQDVQMIPNMLNVLHQGRTNFQLGDNNNLFDFTYVGNTAHGHVLAAAKLLALSRSLGANDDGHTQDQIQVQPAQQDEQKRVDGRAIIITNHSPVYFWDFTRAVWAAYANVPSASGRKTPYTYTAPWVLSRDVALFVAHIAPAVSAVLGLGAPKLTPSRVRYSCMTRFFHVRKAERALGYSPMWSLDEGIERTVRWFKEREEEEEVVVGKKDQ